MPEFDDVIEFDYNKKKHKGKVVAYIVDVDTCTPLDVRTHEGWNHPRYAFIKKNGNKTIDGETFHHYYTYIFGTIEAQKGGSRRTRRRSRTRKHH
jgi:hypothetical protein